MTPKIIMKLEFISPKTGSGLFDYQERDEAVSGKNKIEIDKIHQQQKEDVRLKRTTFYNYMDRKTATGLEDEVKLWNEKITDPKKKKLPTFNKFTNNITQADKDHSKELLQQADKNGCNMWSMVLSFSDEFLIESGIVQAGILNQAKLKERVRAGMDEFLIQNGFNDTAFYLGNVHLNTEHTHIHIAFSEVKSSRERVVKRGKEQDRGSFRKKMLRNGKAIFYQHIKAPDVERKELDLLKEIDLSRTQAISKIRTKFNEDFIKKVINIQSTDLDREAVLLRRLYQQLPSDKSKWRYKSNAKEFQTAKNTLNDLIKQVLEGMPEYTKFKEQLGQQVANNKKTYGQHISHDVSKEKLERLYSVIGNQFLKELRPLVDDKEEEKVKTIESINKDRMLKISNLPEKELLAAYQYVDKEQVQMRQSVTFKTSPFLTRLEYQKVYGLMKAKRYIERRAKKINNQSIEQEINKQISNIEKYLNTGLYDPQVTDQLQQIETLLKNQQKGLYLNQLSGRQRKEYIKRHQLSNIQYQYLREVGQTLIPLPQLTDKQIENNQTMTLIKQTLEQQKQLIIAEIPSTYNIKTGQKVSTVEFAIIKKQALQDNEVRQNYLAVRIKMVNLNQQRKKLIQTLNQLEKNDPKKKVIIQQLANNNLERKKSYHEQQQLENKLLKKTSQDIGNKIGGILPTLKQPILLLSRTGNYESIKSHQEYQIKPTRAENIGIRLNNLTTKLNKILYQIAGGSQKQINNVQHEQYVRQINQAIRREEIEDLKEEQSVEIESKREQADNQQR